MAVGRCVPAYRLNFQISSTTTPPRSGARMRMQASPNQKVDNKHTAPLDNARKRGCKARRGTIHHRVTSRDYTPHRIPLAERQANPPTLWHMSKLALPLQKPNASQQIYDVRYTRSLPSTMHCPSPFFSSLLPTRMPMRQGLAGAKNHPPADEVRSFHAGWPFSQNSSRGTLSYSHALRGWSFSMLDS